MNQIYRICQVVVLALVSVEFLSSCEKNEKEKALEEIGLINPELLEFIENGKNVEARDGDGCTALMAAASMGQTACVLFLINSGADVNARASNGATALSIAIALGQTACVNVLQSAGARE